MTHTGGQQQPGSRLKKSGTGPRRPPSPHPSLPPRYPSLEARGGLEGGAPRSYLQRGGLEGRGERGDAPGVLDRGQNLGPVRLQGRQNQRVRLQDLRLLDQDLTGDKTGSALTEHSVSPH